MTGRPLDQNDLEGFFRASNSRGSAPNLRGRERFFADVKRKYPVRYMRLSRDLKWLHRLAEKEAKRADASVDGLHRWFS